MVSRVVVVGGGIAGLTAAHALAGGGHVVTLLESSPRLGGKLLRHEVAGVSVDVGAEAMLNRRPEAVGLARSLGLDVIHPTLASSRIWTRGGLRPLPRSLMGIPLDLDGLAASGVLSETGLARVRAETPGIDLSEDVSVRDLVASRLGDEVVDRLVEPMLGGVYAGHAAYLSARATVPQLVDRSSAGPLLGAELPVSDVPVFAGLPGGMGGLVDALAAGGFEVRTDATVREIARTPHGGFRVVHGPTTDVRVIEADALVLATPAAPTARLLGELAPVAAAELAAIDYASMAVVTLAFNTADAAPVAESGASGFLVPPIDGRRIKASTFSFAKWDWVREAGAGAGVVHLRTSLGRHREESALQVSDEELVAASLADLADATGLRATPVDTHVQRWGGGLPQYALGHLDRIARIRADVARVPGLQVCGAAYDGVGITTVVASAQRAVAALRDHGGTMGS